MESIGCADQFSLREDLYDNGKRCLLHMVADGRWRAGMDVEEFGLVA